MGDVRMYVIVVTMLMVVVSYRRRQGMLVVQDVRKRTGSTCRLIVVQIPRPWVRMCNRAA